MDIYIECRVYGVYGVFGVCKAMEAMESKRERKKKKILCGRNVIISERLKQVITNYYLLTKQSDVNDGCTETHKHG